MCPEFDSRIDLRVVLSDRYSSHHPQEVLLAQFSLYVHKGGLKPDSFGLIGFIPLTANLLFNRSFHPPEVVDRVTSGG